MFSRMLRNFDSLKSAFYNRLIAHYSLCKTSALFAREEIARDTSVFWFEKPADFTFRAGQYTVLRLPNLSEPDPQGPVRSLSICSAPHEERLGFALRNTQSPFKKALWAMQPGEEASITPVIGKFVLEATETRPLVFIVGGIGITPVRSILKEANPYR